MPSHSQSSSQTTTTATTETHPTKICCYILIPTQQKSSSTISSSTNNFLNVTKENAINLTRPKTSLTRRYQFDGILAWHPTPPKTNKNDENDDDESSDVIIKKLNKVVKSFVCDGENVLIWTFGTRRTGKSMILFDENYGLVTNTISSHLFAHLTTTTTATEDEEIPKTTSTLTVSYIAITGDDTDRVVDCLSHDKNKNTLSRIRECTANGDFYMDGLTTVTVTNNDELSFVLSTARRNISSSIILSERCHCLVTFTLYKKYSNGDVSSSKFQIMDLCGAADRDSNSSNSTSKMSKTTTKTKTNHLVVKKKSNTRNNNNKRKEDKTLKAMNRIIDALSSNNKNNENNNKRQQQQHVPYRDSKMTRLIKTNLSSSSSHNNNNNNVVCIVGVSIDNYDECSAMLDRAMAIKLITTSSQQQPSSPGRRTNRLQSLTNIKRTIQQLGDKMNMTTNVMELSSNDIELDMTSSMDMVALRDALAEMERLRVDPMESVRKLSRVWWNSVNRGDREGGGVSQ